jgi:hypothetical protein
MLLAIAFVKDIALGSRNVNFLLLLLANGNQNVQVFFSGK